MERGPNYWLRWVGVLPVALIAGVLVDFPLHWILYRTLSGGDSPFITPYPEFPERVIAPFFRALVFVWLGSRIAPEYKLRTAFVFTLLWIFFAGAGFALGYFGVEIGGTQLSLNGGGIPVLTGVFGAVVGLYIVRKQTNEGIYTD